MSRKMDELLGHADDNDGIDEYDNPLPAWWVGLFVVTIVWGVGYALDYHLIRPRSQASMYTAELAAAADKWPTREVAVADIRSDPETLAAGQELYDTHCTACHGSKLEGGIGPNLVDDEWIHGGEIGQIVATITDGVPTKGMIAWGPVLGPEKVAQVAAFVKSKGP